ncbi:hypothetical protein F5Y01DRAFT_298134 [Xylaria sp. FL0043]|nr:hypothetical protein F5Y01DRAFT_298134 [Xylaria sp. FL0043]
MIVTESTPKQGIVSLLILGAGWTSNFLIPLLKREGIKHAATTTNGRNGTIPFKFDPESDDNAPFEVLPSAKTVLITFPLVGQGQASRLVEAYKATHPDIQGPHYIQFGVTSIWNGPGWQDENSPYDAANPRAVAEDELMRVASSSSSSSAGGGAAVLSLAGLYGADRQPRNWVRRVITSKETLRGKGALHVIHGEDVARAVVTLHRKFTPGKRWILCDLHVYDWWDLVEDWAVQTLGGDNGDRDKEDRDNGGKDKGGKGAEVDEAERKWQGDLLSWVGELMVEEGVRALPRDSEAVGRRLDGRGFWRYMGIWPTQGRIR